MSGRSKGGEKRKLKLAATAQSGSGGASQSAKTAPAEDLSGNRWLSIAVCVFLALAVWTVFGQTRHFEFVNYDDQAYVTENSQVRHGLTWNGAIWAFQHTVAANWHPLTILSHMLDCQLYGLNPGGHHLTNVLLHAANAILLFLGLRKMTGAFWRAAFVAAVFAIHPLRVESVAWVAERKDVLSGFFFMLTLGAYARYAQQSKIENQKSKVWYGLSLLFFALGLMSKPMLVTLPFVLLLLDYWPLRRLKPAATAADCWPLVVEKIPFLALTVAACVATIMAQKDAMALAQGVPFPWRIANAVVAYAGYVGQMFYPVALAVFYPHPGNGLSPWSIGWSALALLIVSTGVVAGRRKYPYLLAGWLWYLGMLVPTIGIIQVGSQARADRYTYLPQIGLYVLFTWGVVELCGPWRYRRVALGLGATAILAGLLAAAYTQTGYWKDSLTLWRHTLAHTPENFMAHYNLANTLSALGKPDEAIPHYERALQFTPDSAEAHYNLANTLTTQGKLDEAIRHYELALQSKPDYADAHNNLGYALTGQGKLDDAIEHFKRALRLKPDHAEAHNNFGIALAKEARWDEAAQHFKQAIQFNPDYAEAHYNLGNVLTVQGKPDEAREQLQQALNLATAQNNTALAEAIRARLNSLPPALHQPQTP